ncbi:MAG: TonB-dependent receptor [Bacteroidales bacterium]|nr:TonB-dependent receptor [Bacteroidales bacterium]
MRCLSHFLSLTILLCWLFSVCSLSAQGIVEGVVRSSDGGPIEFASVGVLGLSSPKGTTTDAKGRYTLRILSADSITLRFSATGFEPLSIRLSLTDEQRLTYNCVLTPQTTQLREVEVRDDKNRSTSFTQIDTRKLDDAVGPQGGVESLLKTLPDVSSNNEMSSQYSVRGGSFDENLVYINGVELYRPMLVRSGQQEGMSIINPDMVDHILFSPGGFDATAGDKMSSVLDITYSRPSQFSGRASASFLGGSAHVEGLVAQRFSYSLGFRHHSNRYLFSTLDTKGAYHTSYTDLQGGVSYRLSERLDLSLLALWSRNRYGLVPETQTTTFGSFMQAFELDVYFDGQELDGYNTMLAALTLDWHPTDYSQIRWITSAQAGNEQEYYDIQSQFWLYELGLSAESEVERFDRGVGTFLEHARNRLNTSIFATELRGTHHVRLGAWHWGIKAQLEQVNDRMREWKWVDSAGFAVPVVRQPYGNAGNAPVSPLLQQFCNAANEVTSFRLPAYLQRDVSWTTRRHTDIMATAGVRTQLYHLGMSYSGKDSTASQVVVSPRFTLSIKPQWEHDMLFRTAAGIYHQPPFYREYRYASGILNPSVCSQTSYQVMETFDWNLRLFRKPFRFTADAYYKYLTNLIPYTIDNLRIRYDAENNAVGYATGLSLRLYGEFVEGLESWASASYMFTRENIEGDGLGWLSRPTDQRLSFKIFFQDYIPSFPWWRMSVNFVYGTGTPVTFPYQKDRSQEHRLPAYFRVDWGNTVQLSRIRGADRWRLFRYVDDVLIGLEVFNLFNYRNVVSYIWVADYENTYYPVPNYLTARQVNVKLTVTF